AAAEQDDQDDDRHEDSEAEEQAERRAGRDRPSGPARGPRVPGRRSGLADPERLEHPGPGEQQGDDQDQADRGGDDLPPGGRFRRRPLADRRRRNAWTKIAAQEPKKTTRKGSTTDRAKPPNGPRFRPAGAP